MLFDRSVTLRRASLALVAAFLGGFVACGGSGGGDKRNGDEGNDGGATGGRPSFDTGVDENKRPGDLSREELQQVCDATRDYVYSAFSDEDMCRALAAVAGIQSEDPVAACEVAYAACVLLRSETGPFGCVVDEGCDITVAEYEDCVEQMVNTAAPVLTRFPVCENVTPFSLLPLLALSELPACGVVQERCGGLLPDLEGGGMGGASNQ
jgi:hypothetical protein